MRKPTAAKPRIEVSPIAVLLAIALVGLFAALWVQVQAMGTPHFCRRRRQSAAALGLLLILLVLVHVFSSGRLKPRLFPPPEDGSWGAVAIDGAPVSPRNYYITVRDRAVSGGRDGCNFWAYKEEPEREDGRRNIVSTLAGCEESPAMRGYAAVARTPFARMRLRTDGVLELAALGHRAEFRRCTWKDDPEAAAGGGRVCVVE